MAVSIVDLYVEPETGAMLTIWRSEINASSTVTLTVDPAMAGLEAVAYENASGPDLGRVDITVPDDATTGAYTWSAEIDGDVVWVGQIFIEQNARNTSYVAHSPDIRSLTEPPFIIYRPEDLSPPGGDGTGDVSATTEFGADNRLIRSDGIAKDIQASPVVCSDLGALSGITSITLSGTVDGRDVSVDGMTLDNHTGDVNNPHQTTFVQLTDAPTDYTGAGGKVVKVKLDETGVEFVTGGAGVDSFTDLDDVPATYVGAALQIVRVKNNETGLEFATISGTGDVVGPGSSTDNTLPRFDGTTGKLVQGSAIVVDDTNNMSGVVGLTVSGNITLSTGGATVDGVDLTAQATTVAGKVTGPASATDNAVVRYDSTTGKLVQDSGVTVDDSNNVAGVVGLTMSGNITLSTLGATVDGVDLTVQATTLAGKLGGSTGATDNRVLRADGTGGLTAQSSAATLDDSGNLSGVGNIALSGTVDGRDVSADGTALDNHTANTSNPHDVQFIQLIDAPISYVGAAGKFVAVTGAEDGLEFVASSGSGDVVGPASATDNALTRFDSTTGKLVQNSGVLLDDMDKMSGLTELSVSGNIVVSGTVDGVDVSALSTTVSGKIGGSVGTTDNRLVRADGTGGLTAQGSLVTVDDSANMSGVNDLTLAGNIVLSTGGATVDGIDLTSQATTIAAKVTGPASAIDNAIVRFDSTTGKIVQDSGVTVDDTNKMAGLAELSVTGDIVVSGNVDGVDVSALSTTVAGKIGGSTGATDNRLLRADGTGGLTAQSSAVTVDDSGNLSGLVDVSMTGNLTVSGTVDGVDVSTLNTTVAGKIGGSTGSTDNRVLRADGTGGLTAQSSGVTIDDSANITGVNDLTVGGNIAVTGTVDGVDVSTLSSAVTAAAPLVLHLTADVTLTSTTLTGIAPATGPVWTGIPLVASKHYRLTVFGVYQSSVTTNTFQFGVSWTNAPSGQVLRSSVGSNAASAQTWAEKLLITNGQATDNTGSVNVATTDYPFMLDGVFQADATPGTFEVQGKTRVNAGGETITVRAGSTLILYRLD